MTKGTMHIVKEDEKNERPKNTSLRNSSVNWIWFRNDTIKLNDLFAKKIERLNQIERSVCEEINSSNNGYFPPNIT